MNEDDDDPTVGEAMKLKRKFYGTRIFKVSYSYFFNRNPFYNFLLFEEEDESIIKTGCNPILLSSKDSVSRGFLKSLV